METEKLHCCCLFTRFLPSQHEISFSVGSKNVWSYSVPVKGMAAPVCMENVCSLLVVFVDSACKLCVKCV